MNTSGFECRFSVLTVPNNPEMFMMNMQVYDVVPHRIRDKETSGSGDRPVSVVWCAVFNVKGMRSV